MISLPAKQPATRPLVSVIVPTFNRAVLLQTALASVLCQTWTNLEVVVIDDGSTDSTASVVAEIAERDRRVRYSRQKNGGVSAARNAGVALAKGDLIAFLDSDDAWLPAKVELQVGLLTDLPEVGMVWSDMDAIGPDRRIRQRNYLKVMYSAYQRLPKGELFRHSRRLSEFRLRSADFGGDPLVYWGNIYSQMLFGNLVHTSTVILRRERAEQVGQFDESLKFGGEDYKFHLATTRLGPVAFLDAPTIHYRVGAFDQITHAKNQVHFARAFLSTVEQELAAHRNEVALADSVIAAILADAHDWLATAYYENGQRRLAARHALRALRLKPRTPGALKTLVKTGIPDLMIECVRWAKGTRRHSVLRESNALVEAASFESLG